MTRRGSLAYYLAAWICGCVFMGACVWAYTTIPTGTGPRGFPLRENSGLLLFILFYSLLSGAACALLDAFLLRRLTSALRWHGALQWTASGAILAPALIAGLGELDRLSGANAAASLSLLGILTAGPDMVLAVGWWLAIPAGAATAYVLYRIDRAFSRESP